MTTERLFNYVAKGYVIKQKNIGMPNDRNKLLSYGPFTVIPRTVKGANLARETRESSSRYVLNTGRSVISLQNPPFFKTRAPTRAIPYNCEQWDRTDP